jgi:trk system potassium uptake protein TrkH
MRASGTTPVRLLVGSFASLILAGTLLLMLPVSTPPGQRIGFIDALFTATSATCVTGLVVRDTGAGFTAFGQVVILSLIQLGGIGIMTFSLLVFSIFGRGLSLVSRAILAQSLAGVGYWEDFWPLLRLVVRFTAAAELLGTMLLFARWQPELGTERAAWSAVFHSVSAFCNAGFSLFRDNLMGWTGDGFVNLVICGLIIAGGLGYLVVLDMFARFRHPSQLSLHSKIVLLASGLLIVAGAFFIWMFEREHTLAGLPPAHQFWASVFQSVTCRTAGFNTLDIGKMTHDSLFLMTILMFIGGSPGSCAGGIKTSTFSVLVMVAWHRLRHHRNVNAFRRTLSPQTVENAVGITMAALAVVLVATFLLLMAEESRFADERFGGFIGYLFETVSALGTVGLSTGVTATLGAASRLLIAAVMFLGRLGPLSVATSFAREDPATDWRYAEEDVMVG